MAVLISGWVALDDIETPHGKVTNSLGGSATCAALAGAIFTKVRLLAAIGSDFPSEMLELLQEKNIDLAGLEQIQGEETSRWRCRYSEDMSTRVTLETKLGVNSFWQPQLPQGWENSEFLFTAAADPSLQQNLIQTVGNAKATVIDTIAYFLEASPQNVITAMQKATFACINDEEAKQLTKKSTILEAGQFLLNQDINGTIIKLGEYGVISLTKEDHFAATAFPITQVVDPTGAGDTFVGGFLGSLDEEGIVTRESIRRAILYGSATASFVCEDFGPLRLLTLTRHEIEERYQALRKMTFVEEIV